MKKFVIILLAVCLVFAGAAGYFSYKNNGGAGLPQEAPQATDDAATPDVTAAPVKAMDCEALYATHEPDEVVMVINGRDVTWAEYFYWIYSYVQQLDSMGSYYGVENIWAEPVEGKDITYAQYVMELVPQSCSQVITIEDFAAENGVVLTAENEAALADALKSAITTSCGEGATEEEFFAKLAEEYLPRDLYERINKTNYLYQNGFTKLYGEDGALVDEAAAVKYLEDEGYISATHILLLTKDMETGEALDEAAIAEKKASADKLLAELETITDRDALVERFAALKAEYCEDTGKATLPDGYTFLPGTMVAEFEDACTALEEYGLSDVVESSYGYHIIMRLPLSADRVVEYSSAGTPLTARSMLANEEYGEKVQAYNDALSVEYAAGFTAPELLDYVK